MSDQERADFLKRLDGSPTVTVTDWEAQFIASNLDRGWFSHKQREIIDRLIEKYDRKL
jgi:hypothetical protein